MGLEANASASTVRDTDVDRGALRRMSSGGIDTELASLWKKHSRLVERVQAKFRGMLSRKRARAMKDQQASLLLIALERAKLDVVETLLEYSGEAPDAFKIDDLFRMGHNRYPIQFKYDGHINVNDLWQSMPESDSDSDSEDGDGSEEGNDYNEADGNRQRRATEKNAFYEWLDTHELDPEVKPAKSRMAIGKVVARGGTFHAEMVLSAMADDFEEFTQARWALQCNDPRFVLEDYKEFSEFIWLRREGLKLPGDLTRALSLEWTDLMVWAVLAGHHEVATALWRKTRSPIRAALIASSICRRLTQHPELISDHEQLRERSDAYEQLAIELLDTVRDPDVAFLLVTMLPWQYMDRVRSGAREEPVLVEQPGGGGWSSATGFTADDVGAELKVSGAHSDQVTLTQRNLKGEKIEEHAMSVHWREGSPPSGFEGGVVSSVQPFVGGAVRIDEAEVELTNPEVKVRRVFLWPNSALDGACSDDGALSVPCMQFVAHRHCQVAFDNFFCGNYPDSKRCIAPHVGLPTILLQALMPFVPIIEVNDISTELTENATTRTDPAGCDPSEEGSLRSQYIEDHSQDDEDPHFKRALKEVHRAAARAEGGHKSGHHGKGGSKLTAVAGSGSGGGGGDHKLSAMRKGGESWASWSWAPCRAIVESSAFEALSVLLIFGYVTLLVLMAADTEAPSWLEHVDLLFILLFTIEFTLKLVGLSILETWSDAWNRFDLVIIVLSYLSMALESASESLGSGVAPLRALRLLRLLRLMRCLHTLGKVSGATLDFDFYNIPKVKFAMWLASHVVYTLLLTDLGMHFSGDRSVWHGGVGAAELLFYLWTVPRFDRRTICPFSPTPLSPTARPLSLSLSL